MKRLAFVIVFVLAAFFCGQNIVAQDTVVNKKSSIELFSAFDFTTNYIWRGVILDNKPNIQPIFGLTYGNFEMGCFNSISLFNNYYEADVYVAYKLLPFLKLSVTDFFVSMDTINSPIKKYFEYSNTIGSHNVIADIVFGNTEKSPFVVTASTIVYGGLDVDSSGKQKLSSYLELSYIKDSYEIFVGTITGQSDFYLNKGTGILNVGTKIKRDIKVSESFSIPAKFIFVVNPQDEKVYVALTLSF